MKINDRFLLSGNEAVAYAAEHEWVNIGVGYPGTPSTEILETFSAIGGNAQWAPNEKVALEVGLGSAFGNGNAMVTMKHVGLNVAADPLFISAYTGVLGALVIVMADDPGMASSQSKQDSRRYAIAAGIPMLEPSDSQGAYGYFDTAINISKRWKTPVLSRLTTCRAFNVAILGMRSVFLKVSETTWVNAIQFSLENTLHEVNMRAFRAGRALAEKGKNIWLSVGATVIVHYIQQVRLIIYQYLSFV